MAEGTTSDDQREHLRFNPDSNALLFLQRGERMDEDPLVGLLRDESHSGCAAVFHRDQFDREEDEIVTVQAGSLKDMTARIIWTEPLDQKLIKVGFQYEDPA